MSISSMQHLFLFFFFSLQVAPWLSVHVVFDAVLICPIWTTLNKMARRGEARRGLWDTVYVNF